jgi:hypothetical protein
MTYWDILKINARQFESSSNASSVCGVASVWMTDYSPHTSQRGASGGAELVGTLGARYERRYDGPRGIMEMSA